jgi:hypothetical protein
MTTRVSAIERNATIGPESRTSAGFTFLLKLPEVVTRRIAPTASLSP